MTTCWMYDQTDLQEYPYYEHCQAWGQVFSRVPACGEYVVRDGKWMWITAVVWRGGQIEATLNVVWSGLND